VSHPLLCSPKCLARQFSWKGSFSNDFGTEAMFLPLRSFPPSATVDAVSFHLITEKFDPGRKKNFSNSLAPPYSLSLPPATAPLFFFLDICVANILSRRGAHVPPRLLGESFSPDHAPEVFSPMGGMLVPAGIVWSPPRFLLPAYRLFFLKGNIASRWRRRDYAFPRSLPPPPHQRQISRPARWRPQGHQSAADLRAFLRDVVPVFLVGRMP